MRVRAGRVALAAAVMIVGIGTSAFAASTGSLSTTGASFTGITYSFDPWPCNSTCQNGTISGMNYYGTLKDTSASDGNSVFVHAKIDAYGYAARVYTSSSLAVGQKVYVSDPPATGSVQLCRDRGTLYPDNCTSTPTLRR